MGYEHPPRRGLSHFSDHPLRQSWRYVRQEFPIEETRLEWNSTENNLIRQIDRKVTRFLLKKEGRRGRKKVIEKDHRIFIIFGRRGLR